MKITVTRTGGIAGLSRTWVVTVDDGSDRDSWDELYRSVPWDERPRTPPQPDRYVYRIQWSHRRAVVPEQSLTGAWLEIVNRVREASAPPHQPPTP
ncbi:protealysin inhibitor emfourin [Glaciihabitans sp. dw_435]|uniref:protealysin inhibitor emfourin n=1 Tax=Glaciihabitans sp. dw_435 TaxID=2720081 RepID=UPI001BD376E5|nr:protealysin inhibitor emfourin [Glaciihabitans sp. dw_435]